MRARLYAATESSHVALDAKLVSLFDQGPDGYAEFLRMSAQGVLTLERGLEAAGIAATLPDWALRARAASLLTDMTALGVAVPPMLDVRLPREEAYLYGVLYVLEMSRLGAKRLARRVEDMADARIRAANRYLNHGEGMDLWQTFHERLEASQAVRAAPDRAIKGALAAFAAFDPGLGSAPQPSSRPLPRLDRS
ncbi:MAG: biliverdin-producing heme oxygenase [Alphaproteobacteria bacterium]